MREQPTKLDIQQLLAHGPLGRAGLETYALFQGLRYPYEFFPDSVRPFIYTPCACNKILDVDCYGWRGVYVADWHNWDNEDEEEWEVLYAMDRVLINHYNWRRFSPDELDTVLKYEEFLRRQGLA